MFFKKKYKEVVTLGCACDCGMGLIRYNLRKASYPFDWMWNLDRGLFYVADIIRDKFEKFTNPDNIGYYQHYNELLGNKFAINKYYPQLAFFNHDPIKSKEDFEKLKKRAKRFLNLFETKDGRILFMYYRQQNSIEVNEDINSDFMDTLKNEAEYFVSTIIDLYPDFYFDLVALAASDTDVVLPENFEIKGRKVFFDRVYVRDDYNKKHKREWKRIWNKVIFKYTGCFRPINKWFS